MLIRVESLADIIAIEQLYHALGEDYLQQSDDIIRAREDGKITISLVACDDDGGVIGHAMFTPVSIDGEDRNWQCLTALTSRSRENHILITQTLLNEGVDSLAEFGYPVCVAGGNALLHLDDHPFHVVPELQFDGTTESVFVCELMVDGLDQKQGVLRRI